MLQSTALNRQTNIGQQLNGYQQLNWWRLMIMVCYTKTSGKECVGYTDADRGRWHQRLSFMPLTLEDLPYKVGKSKQTSVASRSWVHGLVWSNSGIYNGNMDWANAKVITSIVHYHLPLTTCTHVRANGWGRLMQCACVTLFIAQATVQLRLHPVFRRIEVYFLDIKQ